MVYWLNLNERIIFRIFSTTADVEVNVAKISAFCWFERRPDLINLKSVQIKGWQSSKGRSLHV